MLAFHEDALIAALKARPGLQKALRHVGAIPDVPTNKLLGSYAADAPAIYVAAPRLVVNDDTAVLRFTLVVMVKNVANRDQARKGNQVELGIDQLFTLLCRTVNGKQIGDTSWKVTGAEYADDELFVQHGLTVLEVSIESGTVELAFEDGADLELDDLKVVNLDMDIAPHAIGTEYGKWLQEPPDHSTDRPDAQAAIQLPGGSA